VHGADLPWVIDSVATRFANGDSHWELHCTLTRVQLGPSGVLSVSIDALHERAQGETRVMPVYTYTPIREPFAVGNHTAANGINATSQIVGYYINAGGHPWLPFKRRRLHVAR
jgi:hypothetical protein